MLERDLREIPGSCEYPNLSLENCRIWTEKYIEADQYIDIIKIYDMMILYNSDIFCRVLNLFIEGKILQAKECKLRWLQMNRTIKNQSLTARTMT